MAGLVRGSVVDLTGVTGTNAVGERQLTATTVAVTSTGDTLEAVGMKNRSVGGTDFGSPPVGQPGVKNGVGLNNVGLLIKTWGRVSYSDNHYVLITDGSGDPVRIDTTGLTDLPQVGDYLSVTGISSLHRSGKDRFRLILPRSSSDLHKQ